MNDAHDADGKPSEEPGAGMAQPLARYVYKPRAMGSPVSFSLEPDTLVVDSGRRVDRVRLSAVASVRLIHAPTNLSRDGYKAFLRLSDGRKVTISNVSWVGIARIERQDAAYSAFMRRVIAAVAAANPQARFISGRSRIVWLLTTIISAATCLGLLFFVARGVQLGEWAVSLFGLGALALAYWQVEPMVRLNRPGSFSPHDPPARLLPGGT